MEEEEKLLEDESGPTVTMAEVHDVPNEIIVEIGDGSISSESEKVSVASAAFNEAVQEAVKAHLATLQAGSSKQESLTEEQQWDKAFPTPSFVIRNFLDHEKLSGHRNFKAWRKMINIDLRALGLLQFIETENAEVIQLSAYRRAMLNAQTVQYIRASVSKSISLSLQNVNSAFAAVSVITKMYGGNEANDSIELYANMERLRFRPGYNPTRFVSDFETLITEYQDRGTVFDEAFLRAMFLHKITGIKDPKSPFFSFYHTICALPPSIQTLYYVKQKFLTIETQTVAGKLNSSYSENLSRNRDPCIIEELVSASKCSSSTRNVCNIQVFNTTTDLISDVQNRKRDNKENRKRTRTEDKDIAPSPAKNSRTVAKKSSSSSSPYSDEQIAKLKSLNKEEKKENSVFEVWTIFPLSQSVSQSGTNVFSMQRFRS